MKKNKFSVAGMGDLVADLMVSVNCLPIEPESAQFVDHIEMQPGGMGNFLIAGQRIGLSMLPIDVLGMDQNGAFLLNVLNEEGIDTSFIEIETGANTREIIVLADPNGKHAFLAYRDARFSEYRLTQKWQRVLEHADALLTVGYSLSEPYICSALLDAMNYVRDRGKTVVFDPGPLANLNSDENCRLAFQTADVVLLTDDELETATGGRGSGDARKLLEFGIKLVGVKRGALGCCLVNANQAIECPGYPVEVRDTNGAGDSFAAAFIYAYLNDWPLDEVGAFANVMGAVKVQKFGAGRNVPTLEEIRGMVRERDITLPNFNI
jgi:sugar/nucleoside kinase (ribokinase family)